ncbi:MAG TPA: hypothetical protein VIJ54_07780 [Actinomycetes bacterium]
MTAPARPAALLVAAGVVLVEALTLLGYALVAVVQGLRGDRSGAMGPALLAVVLLVWAAGLVVAARGLFRVQRWARAPVVVSELLVLAVGIQLAQGATRWAGALLVAVTVVALVAVLSPPATAALVERPPETRG